MTLNCLKVRKSSLVVVIVAVYGSVRCILANIAMGALILRQLLKGMLCHAVVLLGLNLERHTLL